MSMFVNTCMIQEFFTQWKLLPIFKTTSHTHNVVGALSIYVLQPYKYLTSMRNYHGKHYIIVLERHREDTCVDVIFIHK